MSAEAPLPEAAATAAERRESPRYHLLQRCLVRPLDAAAVERWRGIAYNISINGIGITLPCPLEVGMVLEIEAWDLPRARLLQARLVHARPVDFLWTCGCQLLNPLSEEELQEWLKGPLAWVPERPPIRLF